MIPRNKRHIRVLDGLHEFFQSRSEYPKTDLPRLSILICLAQDNFYLPMFIFSYSCHFISIIFEDFTNLRLTGSERLSVDEEYKMQQTWRTDEDKLTLIILSKTMVDSGCSEVSFG